MWAKRAELLEDLKLAVDLDAARCLDTADFIARHARRYGIRGDLELRRSHTGQIHARHFVLCHQAGAAAALVGPANTKPVWILQLTVSAYHPEQTMLVLGLHTYRRWGRGVEAGRAARDFRLLLGQALTVLDEQKKRPRQRHDNVIALRPYINLPPLASA